jgi:hypothetical protein
MQLSMLLHHRDRAECHNYDIPGRGVWLCCSASAVERHHLPAELAVGLPEDAGFGVRLWGCHVWGFI